MTSAPTVDLTIADDVLLPRPAATPRLSVWRSPPRAPGHRGLAAPQVWPGGHPSDSGSATPVMVSDPVLAKQVFTTSPEVLHNIQPNLSRLLGARVGVRPGGR